MPLLVAAFLCFSNWGCLAGGAMIRLRSSDGAPARLSAAQTTTLAEAIEAKLQQFGVAEDPRLDYLRETSKESPESEFRVIMAFIILNTGIRVSVLENKRDGTTVAYVSNPAWPFSKPLADSVVENVQTAISGTLPGYQVRVDRSANLDLR